MLFHLDSAPRHAHPRRFSAVMPLLSVVRLGTTPRAGDRVRGGGGRPAVPSRVAALHVDAPAAHQSLRRA